MRFETPMIGMAARALFSSLLFLVCLYSAGCSGYSTEPLHVRAGSKLAAPIFDNQTFWRGVEFDLNEALTEELRSRTAYKLVNEADADLLLTGTVLGYSRPVKTESTTDSVKEGSVRIRVLIRLNEKGSGRLLMQKELEGSASFVVSRGESEASARAEAFEDLSEDIVNSLERKW